MNYADYPVPPRGPARRTSLTANMLIVFSSLIVGLLFAEVGIRVFAPQPMSGTLFEHASRGYGIIKSNGTAPFYVGDSKGIYYFTSPHLRGARQPSAGAERILVLGTPLHLVLAFPNKIPTLRDYRERSTPSLGLEGLHCLTLAFQVAGRRSTSLFLKTLETILHPARCSCS